MKKHLLLIVALSFTISSFSQASSGAHFNLTVHFDETISVKDISPHYFNRSGNTLDSVYYTINTNENSIILKGHNSYVVGVDFPLLAFMVTSSNIPEHEVKPIENKTFYYLSSHNVSSYTGEQNKRFFFSEKKDQMVIMISQNYNNSSDSHETIEVNSNQFYKGDSITVAFTNELVKINKL